MSVFTQLVFSISHLIISSLSLTHFSLPSLLSFQLRAGRISRLRRDDGTLHQPPFDVRIRFDPVRPYEGGHGRVVVG